MQLELDSGVFVETNDLETEDLRNMKANIRQEIDRIQSQIDRAKAESAVEGKHASVDWFVKAGYAIKRKKANHQELQRIIAQRDKEERRRQHERDSQSFFATFLRVCKEKMTEQEYRETVEEARRRVAENGSNEHAD